MNEKMKQLFKRATDAQIFSYGVLYAMAWIFGLILLLFLFLRPGPYGAPYVIDTWHYLPAAVTYMSYGMALIVFPFILISFFLSHDEKHKTRMRVGRILCAILLAFNLLYQHLDNEILRFCNMHITLDFLKTYVLSQGVPDVLWALLAEDAGGANLSLILLGVPAVFLILYFVVGTRIKAPRFASYGVQLSVFAAFFIGLIFVPWLLRTPLFGSKFRQARVAPPIILIKDVITEYHNARVFPKDMPDRIAKLDQLWIPDAKHWAPVDPNYPLLKTHKGECQSPDKPYNIIILSFESFRAYSLPMYNEEEKINAAPFLTELAHRPESSYFMRHYTNGHPTIGGFMALHTSLLPHSTQTVAMAFPGIRLDSFILSAKNHRYQTIFFAGSDPDWDRQRTWASRWYDEIVFKPENNEHDRLLMQNMVEWLKTNRDPNRPFILTSFFISNHMPFHIIDPSTAITEEKDLNRAILNTMHYDDVVLKEFFDAIQNEPWFDDTIFIVTADHGLDLGDRGESPDYNNIRAEAMRIPLVIYGKHPRLPHGEQTVLSSHIDIGPTVLDLLGICDDNAFMGHSLVSGEPNENPVIAYKQGRASVFTDSGSVYVLENDSMEYYDKSDTWQKNDILKDHSAEAEALKMRARDLSLILDYFYEYGMYYPNLIGEKASSNSP